VPPETALGCTPPERRSAMVNASLRLALIALLCVGLTGCAEIAFRLAGEALGELLKEAVSGQGSTVQPRQLPPADAVGWHCRGGSTCKYLGGQGAVCATNIDCAGELVCTSGRCATYRANAPLSAQMDAVPPGKSCATSQDCSDGWHCYGSPMACQPPSSVNLGGACGTSADCAAGLVCTYGQCAFTRR